MPNKHRHIAKDANRMRIFPVPFHQEQEIYQGRRSEAKQFVRHKPDAAPKDGRNPHDDPLRPLTTLNKLANFVNPFYEFGHVVTNISDALFQRGKPLRIRFHDAYSKVPPPWIV